jgi:glutamate dehydrogenase (NAD(P)+)
LGGSQGHADALARSCVFAVREACKVTKLEHGASFAIHGFGNAGQHVALLHPEILNGGKLIAVSDTSGGVVSRNGIDPQALVAYKQRHGKVSGFPDTEPISGEALLELNVDILYPAAVEGVITRINAEQINAQIVCELAAGATTPEADTILHVKGVYVIPDFLANAGGITVSYFEQVQGNSNYYWTRDKVQRLLDAKISKAHQEVHELQKRQNVTTRFAALLVAVSRVAEAVHLRGWV